MFPANHKYIEASNVKQLLQHISYLQSLEKMRFLLTEVNSL